MGKYISKNLALVLTGGLAMFSMFFGSGNLVFPLKIGQESSSGFTYAGLGLMVTGIFVPFLGLMSMIYAGGDRKKFFGELGVWVGFLLTFLMLSVMGPFGVSARCILVAYGGVKLLIPSLSDYLFNSLFCVLTGAICWNKGNIVNILGRFLTPVLLGGIGLVLSFGIVQAKPPQVSSLENIHSFSLGLSQGYQTMDLLAAFFFSSSIVVFFRRDENMSSKEGQKMALYSSFVGMALLLGVYFGFVYLGAAYGSYLTKTSPEQMLTHIAGLTLGPVALPVMSVTIALSCLTTLVILTNLFAEFVSTELLLSKLPRKMLVVITLIISFLVSLLGFGKLASWIALVLAYAYPALIGLALGKILEKVLNITKIKLARWFFYVILGGYTLFKVCAIYLHS